MKTIESLVCGQCAGAAYLRVNMVVVQQCIIIRETHRESTQGPRMHCTPKMSKLL